MRQVCRQVSPCLPHNYKDSALPAFVFIFSVENNSGKELKVGVTLCFKNGTGSKRDRAGGAWTEPFSEDSVRGVMVHQELRGLPRHLLCGRQTEGDQSRLLVWSLGPPGFWRPGVAATAGGRPPGQCRTVQL